MPSFKGKLAAGSPRGQTGRCFEQTEHKAEDLKRFLDEAADGWGGSCLACINARPGAQRGGRETSDNSDCPAHAYAEGLGTRGEGNLFKSHSIPLFMRISRAGERRLQGVSGSAWSTAGCRLLIHDSMVNFTWSCFCHYRIHRWITAPANLLPIQGVSWQTER